MSRPMPQKLNLKINRSLQADFDAPLTPVGQTLRTPLDPPNHNSYFPSAPQNASAASFYSNPAHADSDDILTDVDEPSAPKLLKSYSLTFTPLFDQLVLGIYAEIMLLPTTTPFLGAVPPLGLVSRVAHETMLALLKNFSGSENVYDAQNVLSLDFLRNHHYQPIIMQLIRRRFLDLCSAQKNSSQHPHGLLASTSVLVPSTSGGSWTGGANPAANGSNGASSTGLNSVYTAPGLRQLSILNLLLNEQNVASYQQQPTLAAQAAAISRLRSSSLDLRKHSLTRNNSYNGSNWLHVGNLLSVRPNTSLGMHSDQNNSTDSLQLMHDFVPRAFIQRSGNSQTNMHQQNTNLGPAPGGFNLMMLDYQTPPTSSKSSFSLGSTPNNSYSSSYGAPLQPTPGSAGSGSEMDETDLEPLRSRSSSRGNGLSSFPRPLTINTESCNFLQNMNMHILGGFNGQAIFGGGEALNLPFLSATTPSEEHGYFGHPLSHNPSATLPSTGGLRGGPLIPESPKEPAMASGNNKINLPGQFSLSEKKRDSLKMKRGIH